MSTIGYNTKDQDYFANLRMDVISLLPADPGQKILEVGAAAGNTLVYIKEKKMASEVMGVELMAIANSNQRHPSIDKFQIANIEQENIEAPESYFDVIICADVLEHLVDPWAAVEKISKHLKKDGILLVSMPNIREWKTLSKIVFKGDFGYQPQGGIMDRTHLRFFCKKNIHQLLSTDTLSPIYCSPNFKLKVVKEGKRTRLINKLTLGLFENLLTVQYLFIAKKR
ncbi:class I SAM-dependent methyltransferase [Paraflavitalea soli]|uniref:Class I SAM-dependent methyltransferase n=1 Tax=Paraflavitalea soli TaxID=2315862 RepID=A0A3B7MW92_9BACT|nr:class I SAM-dependent methyltransferase [Paraflavitalea soli]AXY77479.1 class I SAM-dependent methyltransferase [Paraflavitalea soli]